MNSGLVHFVRCADGYVCVEQAAIDSLLNYAINRTREEVVANAITAGLSAAPVYTVSEAATSAQTKARNLIINKSGEDGRIWPLVNSAMRLSRTPPRIHTPIGELGEANAEFGLTIKPS